jgi:hypothetical protein
MGLGTRAQRHLLLGAQLRQSPRNPHVVPELSDSERAQDQPHNDTGGLTSVPWNGVRGGGERG